MQTHFLEQDIPRPHQHYTSLDEQNLYQLRFCYFWICVIICTKLLVLNWLKKKVN